MGTGVSRTLFRDKVYMATALAIGEVGAVGPTRTGGSGLGAGIQSYWAKLLWPMKIVCASTSFRPASKGSPL
jgi:hypothetical protein